jgi:hypothetical protein
MKVRAEALRPEATDPGVRMAQMAALLMDIMVRTVAHGTLRVQTAQQLTELRTMVTIHQR